MSGKPMRLLCRAKVNLTLEVIGKRPDGYHDLVSLAHTISLADSLSLTLADTLSCQVTGMKLPDEDNLVLRAARRLAETAAVQHGAALQLDKRVPAAAGLGGGSSDAAAALVALRCFWDARLSMEDLSAIAAGLGSDVPFFLRGGAAVMRGRGEVLEPAPAQHAWLVLVVPEHTLAGKTRALYAALQPSDRSDGSRTEQLVDRLRAGKPLRDDDLRNAFERPARALFDSLDAVWRTAEQRAYRQFHLSGAGPAIFSLADSQGDAEWLCERLAAPRQQVFATRLVSSARGRG